MKQSRPHDTDFLHPRCQEKFSPQGSHSKGRVTRFELSHLGRSLRPPQHRTRAVQLRHARQALRVACMFVKPGSRSRDRPRARRRVDQIAALRKLPPALRRGLSRTTPPPMPPSRTTGRHVFTGRIYLCAHWKISTVMRVDILKRVLYLLCRSEERIEKCGRDELPARSIAVRALPRPKKCVCSVCNRLGRP